MVFSETMQELEKLQQEIDELECTKSQLIQQIREKLMRKKQALKQDIIQLQIILFEEGRRRRRKNRNINKSSC